MADEIRVTTGIQVSNGSLLVPAISSTKNYNQANPIAPAPGGVNVGTGEETISFGDITPGWTYITNLDTANYVEFGFSTGVYGMRLPAGSSMVFKMNGTSLFARANTAAVEIYVQGAND